MAKPEIDFTEFGGEPATLEGVEPFKLMVESPDGTWRAVGAASDFGELPEGGEPFELVINFATLSSLSLAEALERYAGWDVHVGNFAEPVTVVPETRTLKITHERFQAWREEFLEMDKIREIEAEKP